MPITLLRIDRADLDRLPAGERDRAVQIDDELYLLPGDVAVRPSPPVEEHASRRAFAY